ncbi:MAG: hypothetical protein IPL86_15790 [Flavobacteriales bacterium]|nr:hypothetical protein [Flavobacteriales bacterium]
MCAGNNDEASGAQVINYSTDYTLPSIPQVLRKFAPVAVVRWMISADDDIWFKFIATHQRSRIVAGNETADLLHDRTLQRNAGQPNFHRLLREYFGTAHDLTTGAIYYARACLVSRPRELSVSGRLGLFISPSITEQLRGRNLVWVQCYGQSEYGARIHMRAEFHPGDAGLNTFMAPDWLRQHRASLR